MITNEQFIKSQDRLFSFFFYYIPFYFLLKKRVQANVSFVRWFSWLAAVKLCKNCILI